MEDIFQKALAGNENAIKGLYASSLTSAYEAVKAVAGDDESTVEIIQDSYITAFQSAKSYEDFFAVLNKRAQKACKRLGDKHVSLAQITPAESVFFDITAADVPEQLKTFSDSLCTIVTHSQQAAAQKESKKKKGKTNKETPKPAGELKEFEEMVKKYEFAKFDSYRPAPEPEKPKSIAEKLQAQESVISDEQRTRQMLEREKSRKASLIAFVFAGVILLGAIATYFITGKVVQKRYLEQQQPVNTGIRTSVTQPKLYAEDQYMLAYKDYMNETLVPQLGIASDLRIVAYDSSGKEGYDQLNGIVSAKLTDLDRDGKQEFAVIVLDIGKNSRLYIYRYYLYLYGFEGGQVVTLEKRYPLLTYQVYNRAENYPKNDFKLFVKQVQVAQKTFLYAEASSADQQICALHYLEQGEMHEAERLVYFAWDESTYVYLQASESGVYAPLYISVSSLAQPSKDYLPPEYVEEIEAYGFEIGIGNCACTNEKELFIYLNKALKKAGMTVGQSLDLSQNTGDKADYFCYLRAINQLSDLLSHREIVGIADFTGLKAFLAAEQATTQPSTTQSTQTQTGTNGE